MKILFMGTPDFAVPSLEILIKSGYEVCGVITQPDKPKGRGMKLTPPPVKEVALTHNIPVFQPATLKNGAADEILHELNPDIIVVVAYGKILPKYILDYPKYGCINVHGSLLPKYRGAAPIQRAVINGENVTGVTTMFMDVGMDTGDMLIKSETEIGKLETSEELFDRLSELGAKTLIETLKEIENGQVIRTRQNDNEATYAAMINKIDAKINWQCDDKTIINLIRGNYPWPIAFTDSKIGNMKIFKAIYSDKSSDKEPGTILGIEPGKGLEVVCGNHNTICITELQFEGSKRMTPEEYFRGHENIFGSKLS